ncbi:transposase [Deinococcus hopiensis]|uniref:transposase n=1 Tax=Deinococcus hopiensis TaxID=309885 RepID=UPI000A072E44|nr:transposase [Deinococcus hopiensis]
MDEHRLGLQPILRTVWAPTGQPLVRPVHPRDERRYIYAFVNPESGESRFWLVPVLNKEAYQAVMAAFAKSVGAGEDPQVLVVQDGGGFHVPAPQGHPPGVEPLTLPLYAPELQPAERLWALTDRTVANRYFDTLHDFSQTLAQQCAWLGTQPDLLSHHTLFHWWPLLSH